MQFFIYILFSESKNKDYIGSTANLEQRLVKHNQNHKGFTGRDTDWKIVYHEKFDTRMEAAKRELQIKKWKSRKMVESLIDSQS